MAKYDRQMNPNALSSPYDADSLSFNQASGARKTLPTGPHLLPIPSGAGTWTTNVTTATNLGMMGLNIAVYNNSGSVGTVTIGNSSSITSQAIGASDANGNVGVPCTPNSWTYLSMGTNSWIIASAATLFVYLYDDNTWITTSTP